MDNRVTRQSFSKTLLYRCTCGTDLQLDRSLGGTCHHCQRIISPKVLGHHLAMTVTLNENSFEVVQATSSSESDPQDEQDQSLDQTIRAGQPLPLAQDDPGILVGEKFGHFELRAPLGRGGMGQVYRALDTSLQRYVAVKVLRSGIGGSSRLSKSSEQEIDKLLQEAIAQARVTHPNIVTIYYVGRHDGNPFLAMELIPGMPLSKRIAESPMSFAEVATLANQIAEALKFSYELDIIHGDIKPSNVLLQENGVAKLSDFGMAKRVSDQTDDSIGGTPNYIAPELLQGGKPSLQSDIYALGVTLFEMTFSRLPINISGSTVADWTRIHNESEIQFPQQWPDQLPEAWRDLLSKMLAKDPDVRHHDYGDLLNELKRLAPRDQVNARPFPRIVAAGIDWISVLLLVLGIQFMFSLSEWNPVVNNVFRVFDFIPIVIYTLIVYFWRQSLGRSLMHIRVVNRYGLSPTRSKMALRSLMRMQFPWLATLLSFFNDPTKSWVGIIIASLVLIAGIVLALDLAFMTFYQQRRSLHDVACDTRVILDTDI